MKKILGISLCALFAVSTANANIAAQSYVDGITGGLDTRITNNLNAITVNAEDIADLDGRVNANAEDIAGINDDIEGMSFTGITGQYVAGVSQSGGTIAATGASFADTVTPGGAIAPKSSAVAAYVTEQVNGINTSVTALTGRVDGHDTDISGLTTSVNENAANIEGLQRVVTGHGTNITNNATAITEINSSMEELSGKVTQNTADIASHETKIGEHTGILSPSAQCMDRNNSNGCTLVVKNGNFSWEAIVREPVTSAE